jgi:hypothetical protein
MKTQSRLLIDAIDLLKPNSQYVITDNDYSTIEWHVLDGDAPTQSEIDAAIDQVKANDIALESQAQAAKASAQAKLEALGLTADDLVALGL